MKINTSEFIISVAKPDKILRDDLLEVAFVGRSNVGKSSLLNMLTNRKKLAKTSGTPGRTRLINYFLINNEFYFVDLPGYGYAKASKKEIEDWQSLIEPYLVNNKSLKCVCVLVDIRHKPSELDIVMIEFLSYYNIPFVVVATKADKLSKSRLHGAISSIATELKIGVANIIATSNTTRLGKEKLLQEIEKLLKATPVSFDEFDEINDNN